MSGKSKKKVPAAPSSPPASPAGEMPAAEDSRSLKSENFATGLNDRWTVPMVCLVLAAITLAVFGQTLRHEFVDYDDNLFVYENPTVTRGLNLKGIGWAFTHVVCANWHPLTIMSHMLDCQLYGLKAGGHHLTNVLLHTASVLLLFLVLRRMTGALWRSALVAAVFAIHPLRVESVAWVAERKDVLSGLFFMLTLWAYARYVRRPFSLAGYLLVVFLFALGLLSKPMVVTLPFVLLLLDYWPLNRFTPPPPAPAVPGNGDSLKNHSVPWRLILEKIPLLALSGAVCVATMVVEKNIITPEPLSLRIDNAVVSYVVYLRQMVCPAGLAVFYPYPQNGLPGWEVTLAVVLLAVISIGAFLRRQKEPYLLIGWLWYLGMLVPAIGLVQSGLRAHADRYTYLPQIGLYFALTWAAGNLCAGWRHHRQVLGGVAAVVITALSVGSFIQTSYWRNSELLWIHTLACTSDNDTAHNNLGNDLLLAGQVDEAIAHFQKALQIKPDYALAHNNLGYALFQKGNVDEAISQYQTALQITPDSAEVHINLGNALFQKGSVDEAISQYQTALQITPDDAKAWYNLGNALLQKGGVDEAISQYQKALQIRPDYAEAHNNLGGALFQKGKVDEAISQYQTALQIKPADAEAYNNLGNVLLQTGKVDEAITQYQKALQIKPDNAKAHYNFGNALVQEGRTDEAFTQYQKALQIKPDYAEAHNNLGYVLLQKGSVDEAIAHCQKALQIKPDYAEAHNNLGNALLQKGSVDEAFTQYQKALQIKPDYAEAHNNLGYVLLQKGKMNEAIIHFQKALQIKPDYAEAHYNFGNALLQKGSVDEAIIHFQKALQIKPDNAKAHINLGSALLQKGKVDEAIIHFQKALQIKPDNAKAHIKLGSALLQKGKVDEAIIHFQKALQIKPDSPDVLNNLAWLLATCPDSHVRDGVQAVKYAGRACELTHYGVPPLVGTLAAAYAEAGRYDDAIAAGQKACALATAAGERELLEKNQQLLALYRAHQPYHEAVGKVVPAAP
jgi:tetratricopeptide (TPR) repeat protein